MDYRAPVEDMRFLMNHVFDLPQFWQSLAGLAEVDADTAEAILEEAAKLCEGVIGPLNREADEQGCTWSEGQVTTPAGFKAAYDTLCEGGWIGLGGNPEYDGLGMPKTLASLVEEMIQGACMSFGLAPMLTAGACLALDAHGSVALKQRYLPKLYSGQWSGAMDLTEPHAGTDLGLIRTRAEPVGGDQYAITGTKIFITWGEHDMAENIVHLVLAKLPDAPPGSKGISMFLVPKFVPNDDGTLGARNAVSCGSLEKKMGIKASATCVMNFDGATGWMVGEPHKGLAAMFTMMNYERLVVGIQAVGAAQASHQNAKAYAKERLQSRSPGEPLRPNKEADPIWGHPDVSRMLMKMKAKTEASRAFYVYVAMALDTAKFSQNEREQAAARDKVDLLTPVAKAFLTDEAFESTVLGQQVLGGHGYIREWGQEQLVRDTRITQIYEGTNGIQAMDLMGRKTLACKGELLAPFVSEIQAFIEQNQATLDALGLAKPMYEAIAELENATQSVLGKAQQDPLAAGAVAVDYLHLLGCVSFGYMWLKMAVAASEKNQQIEQSKIKTAQFYMQTELGRCHWLSQKVQAGAGVLAAIEEEDL